QDTQYNSAGHKVIMPSWPAIAHVDIDHDGDRDIVITPHADNNNTANYNNVAWYKNNGSDLNPQFVYQHDTLLTPSMIDVGSYSYPRFFDYDKDNKPDLFVGTEGYYDNVTGTKKAKLAYYRNTSSIGQPSFELITKDFLGLSAMNYSGIFPAFGDITGDGVDDLLIGNIQGTVKVYKNFATTNFIQPNFIFFTDSIPGVFVNKYSAPWVEDFNLDGKTDLLVGNQVGRIAYYEDTSSTSQKKLALKTVALGGVLAGTPFQTFGYATPIIARTDNLPKRYLLTGNNDGMIERYDNVINNLSNFTCIDTQYSLIQTTARSVPAIADIDGDGSFEMLVGNSLGGLHYYKQTATVSAIPEAENPLQQFMLYPNPNQGIMYLVFEQALLNKPCIVRILDVQGRTCGQYELLGVGQKQFKIQLPNLNAGMYFVHFEYDGQKQVRKILVQP
ncbi:MAG: T9SS type A sorting domain-containing protein, partial [Chitinophagaceae bacterium]|nr:T9SS type A sorting domain-containing protein [Chitinophagaceae bacterium]